MTNLIHIDEENIKIGNDRNTLIIHYDSISVLRNGQESSLEDMLNEVMNMEMVPLIKSEWHQTGDTDEWKCGSCGHAECCFDYDPIDDLGMNYCKNCGAKMVGRHYGNG